MVDSSLFWVGMNKVTKWLGNQNTGNWRICTLTAAQNLWPRVQPHGLPWPKPGRCGRSSHSQSYTSHSSPVQIQWEAGGLEMSIQPPTRGTDIHNLHMISLLGTASQAACKRAVHLTASHQRTPKKQLQEQAWEYISSHLKHYLILADDKLSFLSKASLNLTFALSAPRAKLKSQFKQKDCKL